MGKFGWILVGCCLCLLVNCSAPRVITYPHAGADFSKYRSFKIKPHTQIQDLSEKGHQTYQKFDRLISDQMIAKGYNESHQPDLVIIYEISSGLSQNTQTQYYDRYPYWYYPSYSYNSTPQEIEAMFSVEMKESESKKTVWTGSGDVTLKPRRDDNEEKIEHIILEIFSRFGYTAPE